MDETADWERKGRSVSKAAEESPQVRGRQKPEAKARSSGRVVNLGRNVGTSSTLHEGGREDEVHLPIGLEREDVAVGLPTYFSTCLQCYSGVHTTDI